eukprot:CAMPEP_0178999428 /NCGR_PEP_ID=MMETSP0795-20121207/10057_1 /TAXON_ID=88552 /ORGANISM="Amoebophrya sp., Strain Ameob2" /LENGTH=99 /DNA_ID=CAMNT_0020692205 /DNA_START=272 /DNA_END=569 /DNA_ORIENTATION=+
MISRSDEVDVGEKTARSDAKRNCYDSFVTGIDWYDGGFDADLPSVISEQVQAYYDPANAANVSGTLTPQRGPLLGRESVSEQTQTANLSSCREQEWGTK